jgi:fructose-bisphosphate aldolase class I
MVAPGKGILAADESSGTIKNRFDAIGVESTEANRRDYREMLFRTAGANEFISGVILYDETIRQKAADGSQLVDVLKNQGMIPGIKVDAGTIALPGSPNELVTQGLDGLRERFAEYKTLGARFSKWRAVIKIADGIPSDYCIQANAQALARYAALSQEAGIVPMVEPEVLLDGDHTIEACYDASVATLRALFNELERHRVLLEGTILKTNMSLSGNKAANRAPAAEVARLTVDSFFQSVPAAIPGIVFLSGGMPDDEATVNLDAVAREAQKRGNCPWEISFSYGRGLQGAPQKAWSGKAENVKAAQAAYYHRAKVTSAARKGVYSPEMEKEMAVAAG